MSKVMWTEDNILVGERKKEPRKRFLKKRREKDRKRKNKKKRQKKTEKSLRYVEIE